MKKDSHTQLCNFCKEREAITSYKISQGSKITNYIVISATVTKAYLLIPICEVCNEEITQAKIYSIIHGFLSCICLVVVYFTISSFKSEINLNQPVNYDLILLIFAIILFILFLYFFCRNFKKFSLVRSNYENPKKLDKNSQIVYKFQIKSEQILWIEKQLLKLNDEICGENRPQNNSEFFQVFPKVLLTRDKISTRDVEEAIFDLVKQTEKRIGKLKVPFRKPVVEFTSNLPKNEPGHIEFGWDKTIIRIHPDFIENPFGLASVLCHELAHFILDQNGLRKSNEQENEKFTDFFVFRNGQGLIYLQGILDLTANHKQTTESKLGYLSLEEMAYAHVRCAAQHGLLSENISPDYYSGRVFEEVKKAITFLTFKNDASKKLAEMIICPNNHLLRISSEKKSQKIRCPKCKWEKEVWLNKKDHLNFLIEIGTKEFDLGNYNKALIFFREAQQIDKLYSIAFCSASRCLKKLGKKQEAIRELRKILSIYPEDILAQEEMKVLIYD